MAKQLDKCVQPAGGPLLEPTEEGTQEKTKINKGAYVMQARIGKPAPDFEASAYVKEGFKNIKLSDHKGKWVLLCFYPGDFTFV